MHAGDWLIKLLLIAVILGLRTDQTPISRRPRCRHGWLGIDLGDSGGAGRHRGARSGWVSGTAVNWMSIWKATANIGANVGCPTPGRSRCEANVQSRTPSEVKALTAMASLLVGPDTD